MATSFRYEGGGGSVQTLQDGGQGASTAVASGAAYTASTGNPQTVNTYDNTATGNQWFWADFEVDVTFGTAPTANKTIELYAVPSLDGTNFLDSDNTNPPLALFLGAFTVKPTTALQRLGLLRAPLPPEKLQFYVRNQTDQTMPTGWLLKMLPYREQGV